MRTRVLPELIGDELPQVLQNPGVVLAELAEVNDIKTDNLVLSNGWWHISHPL